MSNLFGVKRWFVINLFGVYAGVDIYVYTAYRHTRVYTVLSCFVCRVCIVQLCNIFSGELESDYFPLGLKLFQIELSLCRLLVNHQRL